MKFQPKILLCYNDVVVMGNKSSKIKAPSNVDSKIHDEQVEELSYVIATIVDESAEPSCAAGATDTDHSNKMTTAAVATAELTAVSAASIKLERNDCNFSTALIDILLVNEMQSVAFLMGTHSRLGVKSTVRSLSNCQQALQLICAVFLGHHLRSVDVELSSNARFTKALLVDSSSKVFCGDVVGSPAMLRVPHLRVESRSVISAKPRVAQTLCVLAVGHPMEGYHHGKHEDGNKSGIKAMLLPNPAAAAAIQTAASASESKNKVGDSTGEEKENGSIIVSYGGAICTDGCGSPERSGAANGLTSAEPAEFGAAPLEQGRGAGGGISHTRGGGGGHAGRGGDGAYWDEKLYNPTGKHTGGHRYGDAVWPRSIGSGGGSPDSKVGTCWLCGDGTQKQCAGKIHTNAIVTAYLRSEKRLPADSNEPLTCERFGELERAANGGWAGAGGGALELRCALLRVSGPDSRVSSDGTHALAGNCGGGAGGSLLIQAHGALELGGGSSMRLSADGGDGGSQCGGGGGGYVAVHCSALRADGDAEPPRLAARPGLMGWNHDGAPVHPAEPGSVHLSVLGDTAAASSVSFTVVGYASCAADVATISEIKKIATVAIELRPPTGELETSNWARGSSSCCAEDSEW